MSSICGWAECCIPQTKGMAFNFEKNSEHLLCHCQTFILFGSYYAPPWKTQFLFSPKIQARVLEVCSVDVIRERARENAANVPV